MKMSNRLTIAFICMMALYSSCNQSGGDDKTQIQAKYDQQGHLEAEISHLNGVKHGPAKYYYDNGKLRYLIRYEQGKKHGESIWYYESGKVYQVTPFNLGEEHGIKKRYYESGKRMAEVPYIHGIQQPGLKEYKENGTLVTDYPEIVFRKPEKTTPDRYFLRFHMSNNTPKVLFRQIVISSSGDTTWAPVYTREGIGEIPFFVAKGGSSSSTVKIQAVVQTPYNNRYITEDEYLIKITNP